MGDRLATIDMGRKEGAALPLPEEASWVPVLHNVAWAGAYLCTKWHLDPSSRLATTDMVENCWPVTVGVVELGVVDTRYGVSQPGADAERYRCACLHCTQGLAGRGDGYQCGLDWGRSGTRLSLH